MASATLSVTESSMLFHKSSSTPLRPQSKSSSSPRTAVRMLLSLRRGFSGFRPPLPSFTPVTASFPAVTLRCSALMDNGSPSNGILTVGDFMTRKEELHVVRPTTTVNKALEMLVENRITGFPVIDDDWKLVGVVSDYDLLALDSISGRRQTDTNMFPQVDSSWKTFNEIQNLLGKTNGKLVADVMTVAPLAVRESTNLEDAARLLLESKYRRLPVVDARGELVGIITRGNVVRAALRIKHENERRTQV